jgi:hypothetical protein
MNDEDLRDLFAGLALQGMVARHNPHDLVVCATHAYKIADAMIEAKYAQPEVGIAAVKKPRKTKEQL